MAFVAGAAVALAPRGVAVDPEPPRFPPWRLEVRPPGLPSAVSLEPDAGGSRCPERAREALVVLDGGEAVWGLTEALALRGSVVVAEGRHAGERALPLAALLDGAGRLEVWPCRGEPLAFDEARLRADPGRYLLVRSGRGTLKLLDRDGGRRGVLKNVAAVRRDRR